MGRLTLRVIPIGYLISLTVLLLAQLVFATAPFPRPGDEEVGLVSLANEQTQADAQLLNLAKLHTEQYRPEELKRIVRTIKADPQPSRLIIMANYWASTKTSWPVESFAYLFNRGTFAQLSCQAQALVMGFKLKHFLQDYPDCQVDFVRTFAEREWFFHVLFVAVRCRQEEDEEILALLFSLDTRFLSPAILSLLLNSFTHEERLFLLAALNSNGLLSPEIETSLTTLAQKDAAAVRTTMNLHKSEEMRAARLETLSTNLDTVLGMAPLLLINDALKDTVAAALREKNSYLIALAQAVREKKFSLLVPLVVYGAQYLSFESLLVLYEISAQVENPFVVYLTLKGMDANAYAKILAHLSVEASCYVLAVLESKRVAERIIDDYYFAHQEFEKPEDEEAEQLLSEVQEVIRSFIKDARKFPYSQRDLVVLEDYLSQAIAQHKLPTLAQHNLLALCNGWDSQIRRSQVIPSMRSGR